MQGALNAQPFQVVHSTLKPRRQRLVTSTRASQPHRQIELVVSDVDGTLLNSQQELSTVVENAVNQCHHEAGVPVIIATGKAIGPWTTNILPRLPKMPQVFLQGLLIRDAEGNTIYSRELEHDIIHDAIDFAEKLDMQLIAYLGDRIICSQTDDFHTPRLMFYNEPPPESVGCLRSQIGKLQMVKLIFMAEQLQLDTIRPELEELFANRATLTTALTGMLEVLPLGASKGAALQWLLPKLNVDPEKVMALGDGENDTEMFKFVGLGVAVGK